VGFDILSLTNNHILDFGEEYARETINRIKSANIDIIGNPLENETPLIKRLDNCTVAFAGFNLTRDGNTDGIEDVFMMAETLSELSDISIVSLHWGMGNEKVFTPSPDQVKLARELIDNGIDIISGHHSHTFQPVECYSGGVIAYSLGNFIFYSQIGRQEESGILNIRYKNQTDMI